MLKNTRLRNTSILSLIALVCLLMSAACSNGIESKNSSAQAIDIQVTTVQDALIAGRAVLIDTHITQGNKNVKDADQVQLEIWKQDSERHQTVTAKHWLDGTYRTQTSFPESGTYYVVAHVQNQDTAVTTAPESLIVKDILPSKPL